MTIKKQIDIEELIGKQYGRLTIVNAKRNQRSDIIVEATCSCGKKWLGYYNNLNKGSTHSCGCLYKVY